MNYISQLLNWALSDTNLTQFIKKICIIFFPDHDISFSFVGSDRKSVKFSIAEVYSFQHFDKLQI